MSEYGEQARRGSYQGGGGLGDLRLMAGPGDHTPPRNGSVRVRCWRATQTRGDGQVTRARIVE